jgi:hypothetical protein
MSKIGRLCTKEAKFNPASHFALPRDVLGEVMLTRGEKLATLERWRTQVLRQMAVFGDEDQVREAESKIKILDDIEQTKTLLKSERT